MEEKIVDRFDVVVMIKRAIALPSWSFEAESNGRDNFFPSTEAIILFCSTMDRQAPLV